MWILGLKDYKGLIRTPHYYREFALPPGRESPNMTLNLLNTVNNEGMVSGQSFGSSVISLACITSMCSVQHFPGGHSLCLAFGSFLYPHPPPFIFSLIIQCDKCLVPLAWGSWLEGIGLPAKGA